MTTRRPTFVRRLGRSGLTVALTLLVAGAYLTLQPTAYFPVVAGAIAVLWLASESLPRGRSILPAVAAIALCVGPLVISLLVNGGASRDYLVPAAIALLGGAACRLGAAAEDDVRFGRACQVGALTSLAALGVAVLMRGWDIPAAITSGLRLEVGVQPNYVGLMALASLTLAVMSGRRLTIVVTALAAVALVLAVSSRGALLTALVLIGLCLWRERAAVLRRPIVLLVGVLALVGLGLLFGGAVMDLFERVFLLADPYRGLASGGSGRVLIWSYFIELWKQSPVVGVGPSAVVSVGGQQFYSHNLFIDVLVEVGVLGLAGFLAFLGLALKAATAPHVSPMLRRATVAMVLCYLVYGLFEGRGLNIGNPLSCLFFIVTFMVIGRGYTAPLRARRARPVIAVWRPQPAEPEARGGATPSGDGTTDA